MKNLFSYLVYLNRNRGSFELHGHRFDYHIDDSCCYIAVVDDIGYCSCCCNDGVDHNHCHVLYDALVDVYILMTMLNAVFVLVVVVVVAVVQLERLNRLLVNVVVTLLLFLAGLLLLLMLMRFLILIVALLRLMMIVQKLEL